MSEVIGLNKEWYLGEQLGSGGFGRVHHAQSELGETAVIKLVPKAAGADREILFEELDDVPNVVPILDRGEWQDFWVLVMPKADMSLRDYLDQNIEHLSIDESVKVLSNVAQALVAIEERVVHRDIKPDNILLLNGSWCLADFGISRYAEATTAPDTQKFAMTPPYAAPEQWRGERASSATDVYSLGVVAYELLAGQTPFVGHEVYDYRQQHLESTPEPIRGVPRKLQSLIEECLFKRPEARPRPQNLLARLSENVHPASEAASSLQVANEIAVRRRAEEVRLDSIAKSEAQRRHELCEVADRSLNGVIDLLNDQIVLYAPSSKRFGPTPISSCSWSLNEAELRVAPSRMVRQELNANTQGPSFEVVAYSDITLQIRPDQFRYEGRSHSLWYCDAYEAGVFRWYETAFMILPSIRERSPLAPLALAPGRDAYAALGRVIAKYQVAWPFGPFDQGEETDFIERWMGWFGEAAQTLLRRPSTMPEHDPNGTWRRE